MSAMPVWTSLAWAFPAFVALAVAMPRHQEELLGRELSTRSALAWRLAGAAGLGLALAACLQAWSLSVGIAAWTGLLTFAAMLVGWLLAYAPHLAMRLACLSAVAGAASWLLP